MNHVLRRTCTECGSTDVEWDYDPDSLYESDEATVQ